MERKTFDTSQRIEVVFRLLQWLKFSFCMLAEKCRKRQTVQLFSSPMYLPTEVRDQHPAVCLRTLDQTNRKSPKDFPFNVARCNIKFCLDHVHQAGSRCFLLNMTCLAKVSK